MHCQLIVGSFHMSCGGEGNEIMINCSLSRKIVWPTSTRSEALKSRIHMSTTKLLANRYSVVWFTDTWQAMDEY